MSENNYLLMEAVTENVVRLYEVDGGAVAIGPSARRMPLWWLSGVEAWRRVTVGIH
jgi:hypothetical protein